MVRVHDVVDALLEVSKDAGEDVMGVLEGSKILASTFLPWT